MCVGLHSPTNFQQGQMSLRSTHSNPWPAASEMLDLNALTPTRMSKTTGPQKNSGANQNTACTTNSFMMTDICISIIDGSLSNADSWWPPGPFPSESSEFHAFAHYPNVLRPHWPSPAEPVTPWLESWRGRTNGCSPVSAWWAQWLIGCCTCPVLAYSSRQWNRSSAAFRGEHRVSLLSFPMEFPSWFEAWLSRCSSSCSSCSPWTPDQQNHRLPLGWTVAHCRLNTLPLSHRLESNNFTFHFITLRSSYPNPQQDSRNILTRENNLSHPSSSKISQCQIFSVPLVPCPSLSNTTLVHLRFFHHCHHQGHQPPGWVSSTSPCRTASYHNLPSQSASPQRDDVDIYPLVMTNIAMV